MSLVDHIRTESARLAALCTACGGCVRACPMVAYAPGVAEADAGAVAAGMRDVLLDGPGTPAALSWIGACTRSGVCSPACPEGLDAAFMMRLAQWRAKGALGDKARIAVREDAQLAAKVKAFARLTLTEEECSEWL
jgi:ferredoxin